MLLYLCDASDLDAAWVYRRLGEHVAGLELVTSEALAYALHWEHRVSNCEVSARVTLGDGRRIDSSEVAGAVNRMRHLPTDHLRARAEDREYAEAELQALVISCLHVWGAGEPAPAPRRATKRGGTVVVAGIPGEGPLAMVAAELARLGADVVVIDQRRCGEVNLDAATLRVGERAVPLDEIGGVYVRLMEDRVLPETQQGPPDSPLRHHGRQLHHDFGQWCETTSARVVNRNSAMRSNGSKPFQLQLIREQGFLVPATLVTNDPVLVEEFVQHHRRVIYKSASSVRSIVRLLDQEARGRLEAIRWCPTQFQQFVEGLNVRVHVVGEEVYATAAHSDGVDYRYADTTLRPYELDAQTAERCVAMAARLGLDFAGIDLKLAPGGEVYCFEVNPSPGFSYFEASTGQPIAHAVARHLLGAA